MPTDRVALASLLGPVRKRLILAVAAQAVSALAAVVPFVAVAELGRVLLSPGQVDEGRAWAVAATAAGALLVRLVFLLASGGLSHFADVELQQDVRRRLVGRLSEVPLGWFSARSSGTVKKAVQDDVSAMHHLVAHTLLEITSGVVTPLVSLAYLFWVDWRMTLVVLVPLLVGLALYGNAMSGSQEKLAAYDEAMGRINSSAVEFTRGIAVVKTFGQARRAHRRFTDASEGFATFFLAWVRSAVKVRSAAEILLSPTAVLLATMIAGTALVTGGHLAAVDLLPFLLLGVGLTAPVLALSYASYELRGARAAAGRVVEVLHTPRLAVPAEPLVPTGHRIVLDRVSFSYDGGTDVLSDVDLVLEPGSVTALVGASGSGKSTLARLLPRFWDVTGGSVSIGGVDVRRMDPQELYRRIAFVFQDVQLLRDTVENNIRLARPNADRAAVRAAAAAARMDERVLALPRGYDSVVGEDARLSGGEAQRLSIARALLADCPVVVLDEATVFADPESEVAVQEALAELTTGKTLLVIAHRLSTVVGADRIVVLEGGRVAESGTHGDLLAVDGRYARMWRSYQPDTGRARPAGVARRAVSEELSR